MVRELFWRETAQKLLGNDMIIGFRLVVDGQTAATGVAFNEWWPSIRDGFKADKVTREQA